MNKEVNLIREIPLTCGDCIFFVPTFDMQGFCMEGVIHYYDEFGTKRHYHYPAVSNPTDLPHGKGYCEQGILKEQVRDLSHHIGIRKKHAKVNFISPD